MKTFTLAAVVLLAGCATTKTPTSDVDARLMRLQNKSREIDSVSSDASTKQ